jgi:hypothetical protein
VAIQDDNVERVSRCSRYDGHRHFHIGQQIGEKNTTTRSKKTLVGLCKIINIHRSGDSPLTWARQC